MDTIKVDRYVAEPPAPEMDLKKIVKILKEIKGLKDVFPLIKISTRSNYEEIYISNLKEGTEHSIQLKYDKSSWNIVEHQLPIAIIKSTATNLQEAVVTYLMLLENLQPFYSSLEMLDDICSIGEPEVITTKTCWRLVKYSNKVFIKIEFRNPLCIDELLISFHGCQSAVKDMRELYNSKCDEFNDETIYNKLLCIFEIPYFPAHDEDSVDCAICLCYRCPESNRCPVVCCENKKCDSTFHISCLDKYLKLREDAVNIISVCIGACPFCKHKLSNSYAPFFQRTSEKGEGSQA